MSGKERNTDPASPRLFECEYITIVLDDDDGDASGELGNGELLDLLEPVHDDCVSPSQTAIPTLSDKEREEMKPVIRNVSAILFECDPMCLNFGSNRDEYDPEAVTIISMLIYRESVDDAVDIIVNTFRHWFDEDLSEYKTDRKFMRMAQRIWVAWHGHQDSIRNG